MMPLREKPRSAMDITIFPKDSHDVMENIRIIKISYERILPDIKKMLM
jgi:hypothetical protein